MIQRIQSVFLLLATVISVVIFFIPLSEKVVTGTDGESAVVHHRLVINPSSGDSISDRQEAESQTDHVNYILLVLNLLTASVCFYIIFLFKNRKGQMKLCSLASLLSLIMVVAVFYFSEDLPGDVNVHYLEGLYLVAAQVFLILAARRSIRRDEALIRAADRIR